MSAKRRFPIHVLATCSLLAGCATQAPPAPAVVTRLQCLPMVAYTPDEQRRAASELRALPTDSMLGRFVTDYGALRAADRACQTASR